VGKKENVVRPYRTVLDTNILVSALLFTGKASRLVPFLREGIVVPLVSRKIVQEYLRVLSYPKFSLTEREIQTLLHEEILPFAEVVEVSDPFPPTCRDPHDDQFLACAIAGKADAIVSGDTDLLSLKKIEGCPILSLDVFLKSLKRSR
jgi:putative PIN family toxin of toxin-antitoxin system